MIPGDTGAKFKKMADEIPQSSTTGGKAGALTEGALEFAAPVAEAGKLGSAISPFAKRGAEALASGAISKAQGDSNAGAVINAAIPMFGGAIVKGAGKALSEGLGISTGAGAKAIERAYQNPGSSDLVKAMRGQITEPEVVDNLKSAITSVRDNAGKDYRSQLDAIKQSALSPADATAHVASLNQKLDSVLPDFGVAKDPATGDLDFRHSTLDDTGKASLNSLKGTLEDWGSQPRDLTPSGLDTLKKKIGAFADPSSGIAPIGNKIYDASRSGLNDLIPGYSDMTSKYADSSNFVRDLTKEFSTGPGSTASPGTTVRKLAAMLKQNNNYRELLMDQLGPSGQPILDQIAGLHLSKLAPAGLAKFLAGGEAASSLIHGGGPGLMALPAIAATSSPRLVGEAALAAGNAANKLGPLQKFVRPALQSGVSQIDGQQ
jgi:hypothetical protein